MRPSVFFSLSLTGNFFLRLSSSFTTRHSIFLNCYFFSRIPSFSLFPLSIFHSLLFLSPIFLLVSSLPTTSFPLTPRPLAPFFHACISTYSTSSCFMRHRFFFLSPLLRHKQDRFPLCIHKRTSSHCFLVHSIIRLFFLQPFLFLLRRCLRFM